MAARRWLRDWQRVAFAHSGHHWLQLRILANGIRHSWPAAQRQRSGAALLEYVSDKHTPPSLTATACASASDSDGRQWRAH
jgi:hypothetical protein